MTGCDKLHEECGVFGIYEDREGDVAQSAYYALYALQHRGQESCGIAVKSEEKIRLLGNAGLVSNVFGERELATLGRGSAAIGHVRYGVTGTVGCDEIQPILVTHVKGKLALCNNGALSNYRELRSQLESNGIMFRTDSNAELIAGILAREWLGTASLADALSCAMFKMEGAYSLIILADGCMIAARDPYGFRPMCIGKTKNGYAFASESCALDSIGAEFVRDIRPGEIVVADGAGLTSITSHCGRKETALCVFEYIYFARPDSVIEGVSVHEARLRAGRFLALDYPVEADVVVGVPDSGLDAAIGYSMASGIPYGLGFVKNKYIGRTFIQPTQADREDQVRIKLNPVEETVRGKRVVLVDDSIVRGTTIRRIVRLLRQAGAKEVHLRITAPPFLHACYFGTDIDSEEKLIASHHSIEEIRTLVDADSLGYLGVNRLSQVEEGCGLGLCNGCFTGNYPCPIPNVVK